MYYDSKTNVSTPSTLSQASTPRGGTVKSDIEIIQKSFANFAEYYDNYMANQGAISLGLNLPFRPKAQYNFLLYFHYQVAYEIPYQSYWVSQQQLPVPNNCPYNWQGLCKLILAEDLDMIEELNKNGFPLHRYGFDLQFAVLFRLKKYLRYILVREFCYKNKQFPLYLAIVYGDNETMQILLDFGARANKQKNFAFALACYVGRYDQAEILVLYGSTFWITNEYLFMFPSLVPYWPSFEDTAYVHARNIDAMKFTRMLYHRFPKDFQYLNKEKFVNMLYAFGSNLSNQLKE